MNKKPGLVKTKEPKDVLNINFGSTSEGSIVR